MLKRKINKLEEVEEAYRALYTKTSDGYTLDVEDESDPSDPPNSPNDKGGNTDVQLVEARKKINEFRDTNIRLMKENEEFKKKFAPLANLDPGKIPTLLEAMDKLESDVDRKLIEEGKFDTLVEKRTERMRQDHEGKVKSLSTQNDEYLRQIKALKENLNKQVIDNSVQLAVTKIASPRPGAMRDILARARDIWEIDDDGNPRPMRDGEVWYGKDSKNPMSFDEYAEVLSQEVPWMFEGSKGGGANGDEKAPKGGGRYVKDIGDDLKGVATGKVQVQH